MRVERKIGRFKFLTTISKDVERKKKKKRKWIQRSSDPPFRRVKARWKKEQRQWKRGGEGRGQRVN